MSLRFNRPVLALASLSLSFVAPPGIADVVSIPASVGGNVADADGDGLGDNHNQLPGPVPAFIAGAVHATGGPGSNGTLRMQFEWPLDPITATPVIESAIVVLHAYEGSIDSLDTSYFHGTGEQDGLLTNSDFESPAERIPGVTMPVIPGESTFTFDVTDLVRQDLIRGRSWFSIQGRVNEELGGSLILRGLQVRSTATSNPTALRPTLLIEAFSGEDCNGNGVPDDVELEDGRPTQHDNGMSNFTAAVSISPRLTANRFLLDAPSLVSAVQFEFVQTVDFVDIGPIVHWAIFREADGLPGDILLRGEAALEATLIGPGSGTWTQHEGFFEFDEPVALSADRAYWLGLTAPESIGGEGVGWARSPSPAANSAVLWRYPGGEWGGGSIQGLSFALLGADPDADGNGVPDECEADLVLQSGSDVNGTR